jgi:hypothetical protein
MTSETVKIPTLEGVSAEGYAKLTVYIDFNFESAVEGEIENMFDRMGYQSGEPDVVEVCIDEVTITESGVETDEEEIEKELEDV